MYSITIDKVTKSFGSKEVLSGIDLKIKKGEIFGLLGPSGAGKTTLIKILTGQTEHYGGSAVILGKEANTMNGIDRRRIGIMMDDFGVYERMTCRENLRLFAKIYGVESSAADKALCEVGLEAAAKTAAKDLSKGMRNRLQFARAFITSPDIIFLDEPTSGLDPTMTRAIHKMIRAKQEEGCTIFLTTHNMAEAAELCDHTALLNNGVIVEYGEPSEICRRYDRLRRLNIRLRDGSETICENSPSSAAQIAKYISDGVLETIHSTEPNLESVFIELTGRGLEDEEEK